ncbi:chromosomal replication initiator protein DnaA [Treponema brennaborense]|uniref:Chromosomal replication initiator protein DnaA n=1 Tax=Treponema brennaborense (strain DSM 12168 / CIP 105900 / DD5/3) TaxID=906968 RepID=F4LK72_TREBD|nr:chromosomal replication initiator protein DnaA [Treponema brennaborense]AEE15461.1 Chromosomal replication initiator protein dnaA [Treponema brennaborense DSM 12168]
MAELNYAPFWEESLKQIEETFIQNGKEAEFRIWFNITYAESQDMKIVASVPSLFFRDQMISRGYAALIQNKLEELSGQAIQLEFIIIPKNMQTAAQTGGGHPASSVHPAAPVHPDSAAHTPSSGRPAAYRLPADAPADTVSDTVKPFGQYGERSASRPLGEPLHEQTRRHPQLNPNYTFDNFVTGDDNSFVYNAALAVSKNPGRTYNPLLIYGGVGLGKTHLMEAIGNEVYKSSGGNIVYITAENFTNEFIQSINTKTQSKFKSKYRNADILLIDDIHFFQDKDGTQEELFHTFNALYENFKQLVFTCDRPVSELKNMTDRLRSRFERGLSVDIHMPKYEIRRAILERKLQSMGKKVPGEVIDLIAQNVQTNVRDLEASLTKMVAYIELTGKDLTIDVARKELRDTFFSPKASNITVENIQRVVADYFGISYSDIKGKKRTKNVMLPRHLALYIARELTEYSTTELGMEFGGRDHTTVMHACQKIEDQLRSDSTLESTVQTLVRSIKDYKKQG